MSLEQIISHISFGISHLSSVHNYVSSLEGKGDLRDYEELLDHRLRLPLKINRFVVKRTLILVEP